MAYQVLTQTHIDQFLERGWCAVEDCFSPDVAAKLCSRWMEEQGLDPARPLEWGFVKMHRGLKERLVAKDFAPKAYAAAEDLVGGDNIETWTWGGFIVNVSLHRDQPWAMPKLDQGWHIDGDFFQHFLDSREQGLLSLQVFSDVEPQGGATVVSEGSYQPICRMLKDYLEGLDPHQVVVEAKKVVPFNAQREACAKAGTVIFLHPFMLHASSPNVKGPPRFIMNAPPILKKHFRFDNWETASVVERSIIQACGGKPFEFKISGERRRITPDRLKYDRRSTT